ncbi:hypothetical protein KR044_013173, partial [Drosophila immigrans]
IRSQLMICAVIGLAAALPVGPSGEEHADVVVRSEDVRPDGFVSKLETTNGINDERSGDEHGNIKGSYSYITPEGEHVQITYVADENGYQPSGAVLPTPPPIPAEILKSLEWAAAHPSVE